MTVNVFSVPIFFIVFRGPPLVVGASADCAETLEAAVIVSVLLSFIKNAIGDEDRALRRRLMKHV
jgi:high-affinity iron transporter